jgi:hypothetical protein
MRGAFNFRILHSVCRAATGNRESVLLFLARRLRFRSGVSVCRIGIYATYELKFLFSGSPDAYCVCAICSATNELE